MEKINYKINNKKIIIEKIIKEKNKHMYLKIQNYKIILITNNKFKKREINQFLKKNIEKLYKKIKNKKPLYSIEENYIYIKGEKRRLNKILSIKEGSEKIIKDFLKKELIKYLKKRILFFEKKMQIEKHTIKVTYKNSNWGSNFINKNKISFSSKLTHFNDKAKDYLIVHELAHSIEPNHSNEFWKIVQKYIPEYKKIKEQLKKEAPLKK